MVYHKKFAEVDIFDKRIMLAFLADNQLQCIEDCIINLGRRKVWKDALGRIEPLEYEVKEGEPYWYIDDKLSVVKKIEKCTPTSKKRYLAGNYFITYESALNMLSKIRSIINDFLASSNWPEINE